MTGRGVVVSRCGPNLVKIRVPRTSACGHDCASCGGCSVTGGPVDVLARDEIGVPNGSRVVFESDTRRTLSLAAAVYLLPLLLFVAGWFAHPIAGAAGFAAGLGIVVFIGRKMRKNGAPEVKITSIDSEVAP